jgi:GNAT superfamily N-acetyltransferase
MRVQIVDHESFEKVLPLIGAYQRFYGMEPDEERNRVYFQQFLEDHSRGVLFWAADEEGSPLGFATLYFNPSSLSASTVCAFNDLYVVESEREQGIAIALGRCCLIHALERGFTSVEWMTKPSNRDARRIYERLPTLKSEWYLYTLPLEGLGLEPGRMEAGGGHGP